MTIINGAIGALVRSYVAMAVGFVGRPLGKPGGVE
jgi:hypothetical protein